LTDENAVKSAELYGKNIFSKKKLKSFWDFFCKTLEDDMLRILIVAAIISIIV
jgi:magnesium-transporting ATPase (P-type)